MKQMSELEREARYYWRARQCRSIAARKFGVHDTMTAEAEEDVEVIEVLTTWPTLQRIVRQEKERFRRQRAAAACAEPAVA